MGGEATTRLNVTWCIFDPCAASSCSKKPGHARIASTRIKYDPKLTIEPSRPKWPMVTNDARNPLADSPRRGHVRRLPARFDGLPGVRVIRATFEDLEPHDCFVTAGNSFGLMTAGIDAAVVRFFGEPLMQRVQHRIMDEFFGEQPVGTAFVVPTGHPAIPFLAHAPTMRVPGSIEGTDKVYNATWAALLAIHAA